MTYSPCPQCHKLNRVRGEGEPICGHCKVALPLQNGVNVLSASELLLLVEKSPLPVLTDFWAPWCAPCRLFAPTFEQAAKTLAGQVVFAKVDTEANPLAGTTYHIRGIPTLILFKNGLERARQSGALSLPELLSWVKTV